MKRRHFLSCAAVAGMYASLAGPSHAQASAGKSRLLPVKFTLDFRVNSQTSPFFLAQAKGYFAQEGLDVQIDVGAGSVASITRVASGAYDFGLGDISSLIEFHANHSGAADIQAVYQYYNRAPFVIIGRKDRGITADFQSLQGKRVAAAAVESTRRAWPMVAHELGLPADLFQWVTTDFNARDNVVARGDVDAATYFHDSAVSLFSRIPEQEFAVLEYVKSGLNLYGNAILTRSDLIAQKPEVVKAFLRAANRALVETLLNEDGALQAVQQREPMLLPDVERRRWRISRQYIAAPDTLADGLGAIRPELLQKQVDAVAAAFALQTRPAPERLYTPALLPALAERKRPA